MSTTEYIICDNCKGGGCFVCSDTGKILYFKMNINKENTKVIEHQYSIIESAEETINRLLEIIYKYQSLLNYKDNKILELENEIKILKSN